MYTIRSQVVVPWVGGLLKGTLRGVSGVLQCSISCSGR